MAETLDQTMQDLVRSKQFNINVAPYPRELEWLINNLELPINPGWRVSLSWIDRGQRSAGLTLDITTMGYDSYHPEKGTTYGVHHFFPVPPASYNRVSWMRWLFDQLMQVHLHEAMEGFVIEGARPYAPHHGPGEDPYIIWHLDTNDEARRTSFRGIIG